MSNSNHTKNYLLPHLSPIRSTLQEFHYPLLSFIHSMNNIIENLNVTSQKNRFYLKIWINTFLDPLVCDYVGHEHECLWKVLDSDFDVTLNPQYKNDYSQLCDSIVRFKEINYNENLSFFDLSDKYRNMRANIINYIFSQERFFLDICQKEWKNASNEQVVYFLKNYYKPYLYMNFHIIAPIVAVEYHMPKNKYKQYIQEQPLLQKSLYKCIYYRKYKRRYIGWKKKIISIR